MEEGAQHASAVTGEVGVQHPVAGADGSVAVAQQFVAWAPRGAQQAAAEASLAFSRHTGMLLSVWKCSQAMPCGSVIPCFSLRAWQQVVAPSSSGFMSAALARSLRACSSLALSVWIRRWSMPDCSPRVEIAPFNGGSLSIHLAWLASVRVGGWLVEQCGVKADVLVEVIDMPVDVEPFHRGRRSG